MAIEWQDALEEALGLGMPLKHTVYVVVDPINQSMHQSRLMHLARFY